MEDNRIWEMEERLWRGRADVYEALIDDDCVMVLPADPFVFDRSAAVAAVTNTPRWDHVSFSDQRVVRPQEGLIAIGYRADARRGEEHYRAYCSTTIRRVAHKEWRVVEHSQLVPAAIAG